MKKEETDIIASPVNTDKSITPDFSMGGINAFYHHCDVYAGRSNYAVCLHTIDAVKEGRRTLRDGCTNAILQGTCPALAMREEEKKAGYAIYFLDRKKQQEELDRSMSRGGVEIRYGKTRSASAKLPTRVVTTGDAPQRTQRPEPSTPEPTKTKIGHEIHSSGIADAINRTIQESK